MNDYPRFSVRAPKKLLLRWVICGASAALFVTTFFPKSGRFRENSPRLVDASNLRQIGQSTVIYVVERGGGLPVARDVWEYAGELARDGWLNDATLWVSPLDPARTEEDAGKLGTVLTTDRVGIDATFRRTKPSWAVPLGRSNARLPETMPVAWTRGLQTDGTWATHSPYGGEGGHVVFFGGEVRFFDKLTPREGLVRFDGKGWTANILEALPPGMAIGEYVPSDAERAEWSDINRRRAEQLTAGGWGWRDFSWFAGFCLLALAVITGIALAVVLGLDMVRTRFGARRS